MEHFSPQEIERYNRRAMAPGELIAAGEHLAACESCRQRVSEADALRNVYFALGTDLEAAASREPAHLDAEHIARYLDDEMDEIDRETANSHLEFCEACASEIRELKKFKDQLRGVPSREYAPSERPSFWARPIAFLRSPARGFSLQIASAILLLLLFFWMIMLPARKQIADLKTQVSELQQSNEALQNQVSSIADLQSQVAQLRQSQAQILSSSPGILVALNDGGETVTLDKQGSLAGPKSLPPSYEQMTKAALETERLSTPPTLSALIGKREALMGASDGRAAFSLLGPVGTAVESDRPTFRWGSLAGATAYIVTVSNSASREIATSQRLSGTEWTIPHALARGGVYFWEVTAIKDGKEIISPALPAPPAKFKVLEQAKLDELENAKRAYANWHLVLGVLYAQAGLLDDAEREIKELVGANPHSPIPQKLLRSVRSLRSR